MTALREQQVRINYKFMRYGDDSIANDDFDEPYGCNVRCCFNQRQCPLDLGDTRCMDGGGYYVVESVQWPS